MCNTARMIFYIVGGLLASVGGVAAVKTAQIVAANRAAALEAREAAKPYELPSKDERNPDVIEQHLVQAANKYPDVAILIGESMKQLGLLQQHLENIGKIFQVNPGLLTQADATFESAKFEILLERVIEEACNDLMRIIYAVFARNGDEASSIKPLVDVITEVNAENQERVELARQLSGIAAQAAIEVDGDTFAIDATQEVHSLIVRLDQTNRKQVF